MIIFPRVKLITLVLSMLAGCGGGGGPDKATVAPEPIRLTEIVELSASPYGMQSIAFLGNTAFVSLSNSEREGTAVLSARLPLSNADWRPVELGKCRLPPISAQVPIVRAPQLKTELGSLWLMQRWVMNEALPPEHSLCEYDAASMSFTPADENLRSCNELVGCETMIPTDIKAIGNRLLVNAGGGDNVLVSDNGGRNWRVLSGRFEVMICTNGPFEVVGDRLLVGGECPLDSAYLRAYPLSARTMERTSEEPVPITLPNLENRNIQFIQRIPGTRRIFAGVEGGLLRSDDLGQSFKFVIEHPLSNDDGTHNYPYIWKLATLPERPNVVVVAGFDKSLARPYLAWSADGGDTWTDLSDRLPGYAAQLTGQVTDLVVGPQGQLLITVNEEENAKGHLMQVTLGR